jgi:sugar lactone lactonase YvrE
MMRISYISVNTRWAQDGVTAAGGHGDGNGTHQFHWPYGFFIEDDKTMVIADFFNHRIMQWKMNATDGQVVAGGNGQGNRLDQLFQPTDVLIDNGTDSLIICDFFNHRVVLWSLRDGTTQGEIFLDNIVCFSLAMDDQKFLYVSDGGKHEVRRYRMGDKNGTLVAGGHGQGEDINQLNGPTFIFVDRQHAVYVSDWGNLRVMRWDVGAEKGILIAGGHGVGNGPRQLWYPEGLFVDTLGNLYVADMLNHRVMLWPKDAIKGIVIAGGNGEGKSTDQLNGPRGLSFDRHGNLYIVDEYNSRIQRFSLE